MGTDIYGSEGCAAADRQLRLGRRRDHDCLQARLQRERVGRSTCCTSSGQLETYPLGQDAGASRQASQEGRPRLGRPLRRSGLRDLRAAVLAPSPSPDRIGLEFLLDHSQ